MLDRSYAVLMAEYNAWMNERVYALCATLSDAERKRDRGAFFKSIHGTLNHLLWGDRAWLARLFDLKIDFGKPSDVLFEDFEAMRVERKRYDEELLDWARGLEEGALAKPYDFHSVTYKRSRRVPTYLLVMQMFNHQTHHRGQLHTLLTQLGLDVGSTDLPFMPFVDTFAQDIASPFAGE